MKKTATNSATNWADRQKANGVKLELKPYPTRNCWKKVINYKAKYFSYPITKEGYESAMIEYTQLKAQMNYDRPNAAIWHHHRELFSTVQAWYDNHGAATIKEQKLSDQVDQFLKWIAECLAQPTLPDTMTIFQFTSNKKRTEFFDEFTVGLNSMMGDLSYQLPEKWQDRTSNTTAKATRLPQSLGYWCDDYLQAKGNQAMSGQIEISTYTDAVERLGKARTFFGDDYPINQIDSEAVKKYHSYLLSSKFANKRLYFQYFKTFVKYAVNEDGCGLENFPNAFLSPLLVFRQVTKAKTDMAKKKHEKLWTKSDIKKLLSKESKVPQRFQCWILLMLNCGMTQSDLNDLKRDEIDLVKGRIVRIRKKAQKYPNPPVVNYKLWDVTKDLLEKEMVKCTDDEFALQAMNGARIITETIEMVNGKSKATKADNASRNWGRNRTDWGFAGLQLKYVKKAGVTAMAEKLEYIPLKQLYLGHSHETIADKHYDSKGGRPYKPLDQAITWLGKQFGLS
tara:strand:+ start:340 stop:1866 length:1527 start_codon:yes stop_codon:yes gene_type:complete